MVRLIIGTFALVLTLAVLAGGSEAAAAATGSLAIPRSEGRASAEQEQIIVYKLDGVYNKLMQCTSEYEFIHCLQLFMVQRIERLKNQFGKSGDIKRDFLDKLFKVDSAADDFEIRKENRNLTDTQLNSKLMEMSKEYYFQNTRRARLEIIPGYSLDIKFPSGEGEGLITFALVRHDALQATGREARKKKYDIDEEELIKLGLPMTMMPFVGIISIFPFIYPWLKMGAIFSLILNKVALVAAFIHMMKNSGSLFGSQTVPSYFVGTQ